MMPARVFCLLMIFGMQVIWTSTNHASITGPSSSAHSQGESSNEGSFDLTRLEAGLRSTKSVGVFTKLSIASEVKRLLKDLLAYHEGKQEPTLDELRVRYNLLINKILLLTQDADPPLAREIVATREPLWLAFADPDRIKAL